MRFFDRGLYSDTEHNATLIYLACTFIGIGMMILLFKFVRIEDDHLVLDLDNSAGDEDYTPVRRNSI